MYVKEKKEINFNNKPKLSDYWMKGICNEKIKINTNTNKTYNKLDNFSNSKILKK